MVAKPANRIQSNYKRSCDKGNRGTCYYIAWTDETGKRRSEKAFRDKGLSEQLGGKREHEAMLRKRGLIDGQADRLHRSGNIPIADHFAAYKQTLVNRDNTAKHVELIISRVKTVCDGCKVETLKDIHADRVSEYLHGRRRAKKRPIGHRTFNHYVQAMDAFCRWLVTTGRAATNPLVAVERLNTEVDIRHRRRALSSDEVARLVESAKVSSCRIQGYDGTLRARLYLLAYLSGLRRKELASLTSASFDLVGEPPTLTVEAACSKHRKRDVLPVHPELVVMLKEWLPTCQANDPLFANLERKKTWLMVKKDLQRVGIEYRTAEGVADFHAAGRHSHITALLQSGATLTQARELARHGDIRMTMRYTHIGLSDQARALAALPTPKAPSSAEPAARAVARQLTRQRLSSAPGGAACQDMTSGGDSGIQVKANDNPCIGKGYRQKSPSNGESQKWRQQDANRTFCPRTHGLARRDYRLTSLYS